MCVIIDNSIGLLEFVFDLNWKPSSSVMSYKKKKVSVYCLKKKKTKPISLIHARKRSSI